MFKEIRTAQPKDCPRLLELLQQICALHSEIRPDLFQNGSSKYTVKSLEKLLDDSTRLTFVAVDEQDGVMGYI
ncbi:MAG: GNAT family N-acetyltransferase, partial [Oscillospiraceae bacterium]|nr:GNAT family N-acetyltransferase [Oscillospiraceae bacterium]